MCYDCHSKLLILSLPTLKKTHFSVAFKSYPSKSHFNLNSGSKNANCENTPYSSPQGKEHFRKSNVATAQSLRTMDKLK